MPSSALDFTLVVNPEIIAALPGADITPILEKLADWSPVMQSMGFIEQRYEQQNFEDWGATFGDPWDPLTANTLAEKKHLGFPSTPEVRTGLLRSEIGQAMIQDGNTITTGIDLSAVPYAAEQDSGNPRNSLPARVLVSTSAAEIADLESAIEQFLSEAGLPQGAITVEVSGSGSNQ